MVTDMRGVFIAIVLALSATSIVAAGPAWGDSNDDHYLDVLKSSGLGCGQGAFECTTGDEDMIQIGHAICRQMHGGNSQLSVVQAVMRQKPGLQAQQAVLLVSTAKAAYCP
jgi:phage tail protein X